MVTHHLTPHLPKNSFFPSKLGITPTPTREKNERRKRMGEENEKNREMNLRKRRLKENGKPRKRRLREKIRNKVPWVEKWPQNVKPSSLELVNVTFVGKMVSTDVLRVRVLR